MSQPRGYTPPDVVVSSSLVDGGSPVTKVVRMSLAERPYDEPLPVEKYSSPLLIVGRVSAVANYVSNWELLGALIAVVVVQLFITPLFLDLFITPLRQSVLGWATPILILFMTFFLRANLQIFDAVYFLMWILVAFICYDTVSHVIPSHLYGGAVSWLFPAGYKEYAMLFGRGLESLMGICLSLMAPSFIALYIGLWLTAIALFAKISSRMVSF